jgi:lipopolysaccharide/colanic/teichoic acid biosynthesis glycosyltransferase
VGGLAPSGSVRSAVPPDSVSASYSRRDAWLRALNVCVALTALVLHAPLVLLIAIAVKLDGHGPVFYRQVRVGLDRRSMGLWASGRRAQDRGQGSPRPNAEGDRRRLANRQGRRNENVGGGPFVIYKFRTMTVDAEAQTGPVWASKDDGRVTRVGRWLRRYRLDEMPQFWNVLKGDMAVVGPRPERPTFVRRLRRELSAYALRQRVPPGITGLAQVHRGADQSVDDVKVKLDYDLEYLNRRSVRLDLLILLRTVPAVLRRI